MGDASNDPNTNEKDRDTSGLDGVVRPVLQSRGVELFDLSLRREAHGMVLRVVIDVLDEPSQPPSVSVGQCADVSRELSEALDVVDLLDGHYTLEVSSPGVERPLRTERDFQRFEGKLAKIWVAGKQPDGTSVVQGTLRGVSEGVVAIELEKRDIVRLPLAGIKKAHLVFEAPAQPKKKTGNQKRGSKEAR